MFRKDLYFSICALTAMTLASNYSLAQGSADMSNSSSTAIAKPQSQDLEIEPMLSSNIFLSQFSGLSLEPKAGHVEALLGSGFGSMTYHDSSTSTSLLAMDSLQLAVGVGAGVFVGGLVNYISFTSDNNGYSNKSSGLVEPQLALGYTNDLTASEKITVQVSYMFNTGASKQTGNYSSTGGNSTGDGKQGGSAIIPAVQFETKSLLGMTTGLRASYYISGNKENSETSTYTQSDGTINTFSSGYTRKGGNTTTALIFGQKRLGSIVAIGGSIGEVLMEKSTNVATTPGTTVSDSSATNLAVLSVNVPIKLAHNFALVPEINYLRSTSDGGKEEIFDTSINGRLSF